MSTVDRMPLDGFEARLLTQLKTQVTNPQDLSPNLESVAAVTGILNRRSRRGSLAAAAATVTAAFLAILFMLSGSQPALVQAFPILTGRSHSLPALVKRLLHVQRFAASNVAMDPERSYAFETPVGRGYVVTDKRTKWLCLLVPGIGTANQAVSCDTTAHLLSRNSIGVELNANNEGREEIVELSRAGAITTVTGIAGARRGVPRRNGILTVIAHHPVTITTTIDGRRSSRIYGPRDSPMAGSARFTPAGCVGRAWGGQCVGDSELASAARVAAPPHGSRSRCVSSTANPWRSRRSVGERTRAPNASACRFEGSGPPAVLTS